MSWGFTRPGTYTVTMQASGTLANGTPTTPGPRTYTFVVLEPTAPTLSLRAVTDGQLQLSFPTEIRVNYQLQRRALLDGGPWLPVGELIAGTGEQKQLTVPAADTTGFLRVVTTR